MFSMRIESVVNQIVRQELINNDVREENMALYVNLDLRMSYYTKEHTYNQSRGLHLIYYASPTYNNVTVFAGTTKSPFGRIHEVGYWGHECSHDSCWRDIGVWSILYFEMAENINHELLADGHEQIAPNQMNESNSFVGFDKIFDWKKVRITTDPNDQNRYRKVLELL